MQAHIATLYWTQVQPISVVTRDDLSLFSNSFLGHFYLLTSLASLGPPTKANPL